MEKNLRSIIKQAIDIHVHIGPEIIPRKYTVEGLIKEEKEKIGGFVLKNHFYSTTPFIKEIQSKSKLRSIGSVVLNNSVGGLNPEAIYATSLMSRGPFFVWFPTINARNFLENSKYEIASEWVQKEGFKARRSNDIVPVEVSKRGKLTKEVIDILKVINKYNAILATGHISWQESLIVINKTLDMGLKKIVITHPIYQRINMPIEVQKQLAKKGCFIEQCYSMYSIDKIPIRLIAEQIKKVGSKSVILSSDVGQTFSPSPSEALFQFSELLRTEGISENELFQMMVTNPKILLD